MALWVIAKWGAGHHGLLLVGVLAHWWLLLLPWGRAAGYDWHSIPTLAIVAFFLEEDKEEQCGYNSGGGHSADSDARFCAAGETARGRGWGWGWGWGDGAGSWAGEGAGGVGAVAADVAARVVVPARGGYSYGCWGDAGAGDDVVVGVGVVGVGCYAGGGGGAGEAGEEVG